MAFSEAVSGGAEFFHASVRRQAKESGQLNSTSRKYAGRVTCVLSEFEGTKNQTPYNDAVKVQS